MNNHNVLVKCKRTNCDNSFHISIRNLLHRNKKRRMFCSRLCFILSITKTTRSNPGEYFKKDQERWYVYWREDEKRFVIPKARWVWEKHNGPIPDGYDIHHKDENKENDKIENLELRESYEHREWHKFSDDIKYMIKEVESNGDTPKIISDRQGD